MKTLSLTLACNLLLMFLPSSFGAGESQAVEYVSPSLPFSQSPVFQTPKGEASPQNLQIPLITWALDGLLIDLNQGLTPNPNTPLAKALGTPVTLGLENEIEKQLANYISGKSPFLRVTSGQMALVAEALKNKDPGLEPVAFILLSRSTGADAFVGRGIQKIADIRGKTIVTQLYGPHTEIISNMLKDANLTPEDITLKYVPEITAPATWNPEDPAIDPANAFRRDNSVAGVTCIDLDALALTGGTEGNGLDGTVKGAKTIFSTRTADNIIFDIYAVRKDFLEAHPQLVETFRKALLDNQENWITKLATLKTASKQEKDVIRTQVRPIAQVIMNDPNLENDYLLWLSSGAAIANRAANADFFSSGPNNFESSTTRIQEFYRQLGFLTGTARLAFDYATANQPRVAATPSRRTFQNENAVRQAAASKDANVMYSYTFQFNPQESQVDWQDYEEIFAKIHETATRYGGAIIQIRGHGDNFFYNFVNAKRQNGETTYQKRNRETGEFETLPLPNPVQILNDSQNLSYTRAFNVKAAYAAYLRERLGLNSDEFDLSRFDAKGMGLSEPVIKNPQTAEDRVQNMRCEVVIISAESELPTEFTIDDLR